MKTLHAVLFLLAGFLVAVACPALAQQLDMRLFKRPTTINPEQSRQSLEQFHQKKNSDRTIFCACQNSEKQTTCPSYKESTPVYWQTILSYESLPANFSKEALLFLKADMHLMVPVTDLKYDPLCGHWHHVKKGNPPSPLQGEIARALFYASILYQIPLPSNLEDQLRLWHLLHPPTDREERLNSFIEEKQGNRNPFIDHPALVERVGRFK